MPDFTTTELLASIKRRGMIPSTDEAFSTADFLAIANEELQSFIVPLLLGAREEFLVANFDITTTTSAEYTLPPRAIGRELRDVLWQSGNSYIPLSRIEPEREYEFGNTGSGGPYGYKFENDKVVLIPAPPSGGTLRLKYFIRPNALVLPAAVATIQSINGGRTVITTTATIPSTITTGISVDLVAAKPGFATQVLDSTTTATTSGTTITLTTALPSSVVAGDYVCLAQEAPVAQIPVELFPLLAERVCFKVLEALGDPRAQVQKQICDEMARQAVRLLSPRSQGSARPIVPRYGPGRGWGGRGNGRWGI
jgi:hypothetical protein